ncbi:MAG: carboxymuconolactone decarboxylase family protein [Frankiales bacterium]|nr:carboxymuconolactone decarboxylase family protein [Frankiales bacterium]
MPAIAPVPLDLLDPELAEEVAGRVAARTLSSTLPVQVWAHRPAAATAWVRLLAELQERSSLPERLRELVRLRIASHTQCRTCAVGRKSDTVTEEDVACLSSDDSRFSPLEQAALRYADLFAVDWFGVDDDTYRDLAAHFSTEQVVELQMLCAMMLAGGRLALVQRAWVDDEAPPVLH